MYCRNCGAVLNDKAEICIKCGCRPLNGDEYCQECGMRTTQKQEMCVKCGCRLMFSSGKSKGILEGINVGNSSSDELNLDFSELDPYYQKEFEKIYKSGETYKGKFNGWALLFGGIWALTKGSWLPFVTCIAASFLTAGIASLVYCIIAGFRGTYWYYCSYVKNKQCII